MDESRGSSLPQELTVRWSQMVLSSNLSSRLNRLKREIKVRFISETEQDLWFILDISSSSAPTRFSCDLRLKIKPPEIFSWFFSLSFSDFFSQSLTTFLWFSCRLWTTRREKIVFCIIRSYFKCGFHSAQSKAENGQLASYIIIYVQWSN